MAKSSTFSIILFLSLLTLTLLPTNHASFAKSISKEQLGIRALDDKQTHLTFYYHDTLSGSNPSSIPIAKANSTDQSPTMFGAVAMMDDPLTEGPESTSKLVGRAQGLYGFADQHESALMMVMNLYFLEGEFNGSTLSILGRDARNDSTQEMPVVGGTGAFRFAKGYAQLKTQTFDPKSGDAVVEFNVFVNHGSSVSNPSSSSVSSSSDIAPSSSPGGGSSVATSSHDGASSTSQASRLSRMISLTLMVIPASFVFMY